MAEETTATAQQQPRGCTGDCKLCSMIQRGYCASQIAYSNMKLLSTMLATVNGLQQALDELSAKVAALQNGEAELIAPTDTAKEIQTGDPLV